MSPHRIGLTGGIGSGKSTVAAMFAKLGVPVLDLDKVGHAVVSPGSVGLQQLVETFGANILKPDASLNRKALAQRCFSNAEQTRKLNAIMHPLIRQAEATWLQQQQGEYAIIEASVLLESGGAERMDAVIVVLADLALRRQRVLARGDRSADAFDAIVDRQVSDAERHEAADFVIINTAGLVDVQKQVLKTHALLLQHCPVLIRENEKKKMEKKMDG